MQAQSWDKAAREPHTQAAQGWQRRGGLKISQQQLEKALGQRERSPGEKKLKVGQEEPSVRQVREQNPALSYPASLTLKEG